MFPERFDYYRATTVEAALDALAEHDDVELLAGGHSLVPAMKAGSRSPEVVVDLAISDLDGVDLRDDGVHVGALTTYRDVASDPRVRRRAPLVATAAGEVGDRQIRNRGTLGGNLVEAHPAADPPAAVLAADATIHVRGRNGERRIDADEFFGADGETAVRDAELVTGVTVPDQHELGTAYVRQTHPATGYAVVGVAAVVGLTDGVVDEARVAATGVVDRAVRLPGVEDVLAGGAGDPDRVERASAEAAAGLDEDRLRSDPHASGEFRAHLLETQVETGLTQALERARADDAQR